MQINSSQHWEMSNKKSLFLSFWKGFVYQRISYSHGILLEEEGAGDDALDIHGMTHMRRIVGGCCLYGSQGTLHFHEKAQYCVILLGQLQLGSSCLLFLLEMHVS